MSCTTTDPTGKGGPELASLQLEPTTPAGQAKPQSGTNLQPHPVTGDGQTVSDVPAGVLMSASYQKFTSQIELGKYLTQQYHIRTPTDLSSCETCHR